MAKTDTRKRAFLKYGITGAALGAAAIAGLDQLFSPNTAPGKETTVTQTSTVTAVLPAPLPSTRIDFRTKAGEYEQSIRYLYGVDKANFCMLCQPIIQECEGLILYVTADTVRNYEALARSLLNSGIDASQKALAAFTDINSKLSALNQGELSILTILQNYKSDSAQYKTALANWINDHAPSGPNANIQNSTAGSSTREWKVMFDSEQLLKQIQLLNGAITADTSPRLGDSSRLLKIQDGYLARNAV